MEEKENILDIAEDNRYKCSYCKGKILKGNKYFRSAYRKWRASHTINICNNCLINIFLELNINNRKLKCVF